MTIKGADRHLAHLKRLQRLGTKIGPAIYAAADELAVEAAISITTGAVSGKFHVASLPGEPPNADTHQLDRSIHVERVDELTARVVADAPHAAALEYGTSKMAERPFMRPAAKKVGPALRRKVQAIVQAEVKS